METRPTPPFEAFEELLRREGFRATAGRMAILETLKSCGRPLTVVEIAEKLRGKLNQVTIYRALEALHGSGLVRKVDLQHPHTHYELAVGITHHHHVVCERCDAIEDIKNCDAKNLERVALKKAKRFNSVRTHSLEFFGICNKCAG